MYNEELKKEYINSYTSNPETAKHCAYAFNAIEKFEIKHGADICTFKKDELMPALRTVAGIRKNTTSSKVFILKRYIKWCYYTKKVPGSRLDMLEIKDVTSDNIREEMVANPQDLSYKLSKIFGRDEDIKGDISNIYKAFYWLSYAGMSDEDILLLTDDDVNIKEMVVEYGGKSYPLYPEALPSIVQCMEQTSFSFRHSNYDSNPKERAEGNLLLRGYRTHTVKSMRVALSRATKKKMDDNNPIKLSYSRVRLSGIFYWAYRKETKGILPDFELEAKQLVESKGYDDTPKMSLAKRQRKVAREYLNDYFQWKNAFGL